MAMHPKLKDKLVLQQDVNRIQFMWNNELKSHIKNGSAHQQPSNRKQFESETLDDCFTPEDPKF